MELNSEEWFAESVDLAADRLTLLTVTGLVHLALQHPLVPDGTRKMGQKLGRLILERLLKDGIKLPPDILEAYQSSFYPKEVTQRDTPPKNGSLPAE